jgi:hypothetical protein
VTLPDEVKCVVQLSSANLKIYWQQRIFFRSESTSNRGLTLIWQPPYEVTKLKPQGRGWLQQFVHLGLSRLRTVVQAFKATPLGLLFLGAAEDFDLIKGRITSSP